MNWAYENLIHTTIWKQLSQFLCLTSSFLQEERRIINIVLLKLKFVLRFSYWGKRNGRSCLFFTFSNSKELASLALGIAVAPEACMLVGSCRIRRNRLYFKCREAGITERNIAKSITHSYVYCSSRYMH